MTESGDPIGGNTNDAGGSGDLPPLTSESTAKLEQLMTDVIQTACERASASGLMPSDETKKFLLKRVSPNNALNFDSLERYWVVLLDELSQTLDRILAYQYACAPIAGTPKHSARRDAALRTGRRRYSFSTCAS